MVKTERRRGRRGSLEKKYFYFFAMVRKNKIAAQNKSSSIQIPRYLFLTDQTSMDRPYCRMPHLQLKSGILISRGSEFNFSK